MSASEGRADRPLSANTGPFHLAVERFPRVRQSRLATFDRCALSAHFEEEYRRDWSGHPAARGTIFHRWAAKALKSLSDMGETMLPTDLAVAILHEVLLQDDVDKECGSCGAPIVDRVEGIVRCSEGHEHRSDFVNIPMSEIKDLRWVVVKFAHETAFDIGNLVSIEERLAASVRYPDGAGGHVERVLTGQLDALFVTGERDEEAVVLDWKDTWDLPAPTEVGFDGYFQQRFYAWLVMRTYESIQKVTLREHYVRRTTSREATVWRSDLEDVEAELSALVKRFDRAFHEGHFPPSPGRHCQICPRPAACPIFPGVRGEGMITDAETAARVAREIKVAESVLKPRKQALAAWTSVHGPEEISSHKGRRAYGHREIKRTARPTRQEIEAAIRLNGGRPLTGADLDRLYKTAKGTRFEEHELVEVEDSPDDAALLNALEASVAQASGLSGGDRTVPRSDQGDHT